MTASITLLNATYEPLNTVDLNRAIRLLYQEKVEIIIADEERFITSSSGERKWPMPLVLRLVRIVRVARDALYGPPAVSKKGVLRRDNHTCAYCGGQGTTVDHVQPKSRGGRSTWMNLVAACRDCNNRKRDRTPHEAGMKLRVTPYQPTRKPFTGVTVDLSVLLS